MNMYVDGVSLLLQSHGSAEWKLKSHIITYGLPPTNFKQAESITMNTVYSFFTPPVTTFTYSFVHFQKHIICQNWKISLQLFPIFKCTYTCHRYTRQMSFLSSLQVHSSHQQTKIRLYIVAIFIYK